MRYAGILKNDFVNGEGVCVSYWAQGCPFHCKGCHNKQTWDFEGGIEANPQDIINEILKAIKDNGIQRNFSLLGGEPLCEQNIQFTKEIIEKVRESFPDIKIYLWTGYRYAALLSRASKGESCIQYILDNTRVIIAGPFIQEKRDISCKWAGSTNQEVIYQEIISHN